ncbi:MAG: hypothetical protein SynsKO_35160 [Synoicihabitans sp.]
MKLPFPNLSLPVLLLAANMATGTTLVEWGTFGDGDTGFDNTIVASNHNVTNLGTTYTGGNSTTAAYYSGVDAGSKSAIFGVYSSAATNHQIQNNTNYDRIRVVDTVDATFTETLVVWESANWVNALGTGESLASLKMDGFRTGSAANNSISFVIQTTAGNWYSTTHSSWANTSEIEVTDVSAASWFIFDETTLGDTSSSVGSSIAASSIDFTAVSSIGLYHTGSDANASTGLQIGYFEAKSLSAVPEPGSFALLASLFSLGFVATRRRR